MKAMVSVLAASAAALALAACNQQGATVVNQTDNAAVETNVTVPDAAPVNVAEANSVADAVEATPVAAASPAAPEFPVRTGKYAVDQSCADAAVGSDYLQVSRDNWGEIDGDTPVGPVKHLGGKRWSLGNDLVIEVTSPTSFREYGRKMIWCKS